MRAPAAVQVNCMLPRTKRRRQQAELVSALEGLGFSTLPPIVSNPASAPPYHVALAMAGPDFVGGVRVRVLQRTRVLISTPVHAACCVLRRSLCLAPHVQQEPGLNFKLKSEEPRAPQLHTRPRPLSQSVVLTCTCPFVQSR